MSAPSGTRRDAKAASPAATAATAESATSARTSRPGDALRRERALMGKLGARAAPWRDLSSARSEEHTSELQSQSNLVCRLLLEKKKKKKQRELAQARKAIRLEKHEPDTRTSR